MKDDTVIISFGEDLAASTLITLHLRQMKIKNIIVKAPNEEHKLILEKGGGHGGHYSGKGDCRKGSPRA